MGKQILLTVIALALIGACAILWALAEESPTLSLQPSSAGTATSGWPTDQYWNWAFAMPDRKMGERIGLRLRQKSKQFAPGTSPTIGSFERAMPPAEADREFGTGMIVASDSASLETRGTASVQLLDLSDIGATSTTPGQTLRVLAKLSLGGTQVELSHDAAILPAGRFGGRSIRNTGNWNNGELYLMSFWVENEDRVIQYDVLLEQSVDLPAH
jgi:hypothetical protein